MRELEYVVPGDMDGTVIKNILRLKLGISSAVITELKKYPDGIRLNGMAAFSNAIAKNGDVINISLRDKSSENIVPSDIKLNIIYEDEDILAVNKPRSMPIHPSQNHHSDTLANGVVNYFCGTDFTFRVITRLDRDTSGVVLIAKNKISAGILTEQMTSGQIHKSYVALCHGCPANNKGIIDAPIARKDGSAIMREVRCGAKNAITEYEVIMSRGDLSLLRLKPLTGRTHQIRVHLSYIGNPIYGDDLYGSSVKNDRTRLHCESVSFLKPITGEPINLSAPIPADMNNFM